MLNIHSLNFDYSDRPLLRGVNFSLNKGVLLHLRGKNGSGKTTLLKLLAGLMRPSHGDIRYGEHSIYDDVARYQKNICYVGHKSGVSQVLTVRENCRFELVSSFSNLPLKKASRCGLTVDDLMKAFSLDSIEDVACGLLSVGQRRRVGLLRLLMSDASLWLLDEPLVALDEETICILMTYLNQHLSTGGQVILTSHQPLPVQPQHYQEYCL